MRFLEPVFVLLFPSRVNYRLSLDNNNNNNNKDDDDDNENYTFL